MQPTGVPRLILTQDNQFFFDAAKEGRLEVQKCVDCNELRHPPTPSCPECLSFEWQGHEIAPRGEVYSFVIAHRPQDSAFDYPHAIALIALQDGLRMVMDVAETPHENIKIGMPVEIFFREHVHGEILPSARETGADK